MPGSPHITSTRPVLQASRVRRGIVCAEIGLGLDDATRGAAVGLVWTRRLGRGARGRRRAWADRRSRGRDAPDQASSSASRRSRSAICSSAVARRRRWTSTTCVRGPGDERLVAELGLRPVTLGHRRGDLLAQAVPLGVEIDHPRQRQHGDDVAGDGGERALSFQPLGRPVANDELVVGDAGQRPQLAPRGLECRRVRPGEDLGRDPAAGLDARLGAGVANGAHGLDQGAEVGLGGLVSAIQLPARRRS